MVAFIETDDGLQRQNMNAAEIDIDGGHTTPLQNRCTIGSVLFGRSHVANLMRGGERFAGVRLGFRFLM